ncbi:MAG: PQQ-dependent sugar dehydrogenase [Planctomycetes bacterium]|nr:PQQ-dependent sugar dehydrogenase [Planctomycetota bacterium]
MSGGAFAQVHDTRGAATAAGTGIEAMTTVRVAGNLDHVTFVTYAPGDYTRLFIVEKQGRIKVLNLKTGVVNATLFLDIDALVGGGLSTNDERGLLGLAFHPDYQNNGYFYVDYTNNAGTTTVARYSVSDDPEVADPGSALILLTIFQPFSNHNGGWIGFGPNDGFLYISTGDGGSAGDPGNRAQDITNQLLGKMLRIDVDGNDGPGGNYGIPAGNPFVGITGDDEIWAYGLRNPWRSSFDRATGDLYIADVGQNAWEEIDFQPADSTGGENYGWRCYEGDHTFNTGGCPPAKTMVFPIHEYSHALGRSLTGGYVYRGCAIPTLDGTYFFADYVFTRLWSFTYEGKNNPTVTSRIAELSPSSDGFSINQISSFGEDARGELYIVDQGSGISGQVFKIVPVKPTISPADLDCDGAVGVKDLLILLGTWGPCDGCLADLDGDHSVGVKDLLSLLGSWG